MKRKMRALAFVLALALAVTAVPGRTEMVYAAVTEDQMPEPATPENSPAYGEWIVKGVDMSLIGQPYIDLLNDYKKTTFKSFTCGHGSISICEIGKTNYFSPNSHVWKATCSDTNVAVCEMEWAEEDHPQGYRGTVWIKATGWGSAVVTEYLMDGTVWSGKVNVIPNHNYKLVTNCDKKPGENCACIGVGNSMKVSEKSGAKPERFYVEDESVATVNEKGKVTTKKVGKTKVHAVFEYGEEESLDIEVYKNEKTFRSNTAAKWAKEKNAVTEVKRVYYSKNGDLKADIEITNNSTGVRKSATKSCSVAVQISESDVEWKNGDIELKEGKVRLEVSKKFKVTVKPGKTKKMTITLKKNAKKLDLYHLFVRYKTKTVYANGTVFNRADYTGRNSN